MFAEMDNKSVLVIGFIHECCYFNNQNTKILYRTSCMQPLFHWKFLCTLQS
jgi:hypothetical protein